MFGIMAVITVRNIPDEVHRALRIRAAQHGRSTEAEVRALLEAAARPQGRITLGSVLQSIGSTIQLSESEAQAINARDPSPGRDLDLA